MGQHTRKVFCTSLLILLVSTQTLTAQRKENLVYTLTFSGEIAFPPTTVKVISQTPTTLKVDPPITLDLTAFVSSHFPAGEGLSCFGAISPNLNAKKALVRAAVEVHDPKVPGDPSQAVVIITFNGWDLHREASLTYILQFRGTRDCTKFPQSSKQTCTIDLIGWRVNGIFGRMVYGGERAVGGVLPWQGCVSDPIMRYDSVSLSSQVTLTAQ